MADHLTVRQAESVRLMIDATRLVNRLQDYIHDDEAKLDMGKITAAKILLDKALPSLQSADITAHSSPQIESEEALQAKLLALIQSNPLLIRELAKHLGPKALVDQSSQERLPVSDPRGNSGGNTGADGTENVVGSAG